MTPKDSEVDRLEAPSGDRTTPFDLMSVLPLAQRRTDTNIRAFKRLSVPGVALLFEPEEGRGPHHPRNPFPHI